jgi:transcriptional regulator with XRE-family HTH domain
MADSSGHGSPGQAFARLISNRRQKLGLTQVELCALAGISVATIRRWETGAFKDATPERIGSLCKALDIDPADAAAVLGYTDEDSAKLAEAPDKFLGNTLEVERYLTQIRDNRSRSAHLRDWAQRLLDQVAEIREQARAEIRASGDQPAKLAAALRLTHVPTLTVDQRRNLDAAIARAEADADAIYGDTADEQQRVA